MRLLTLEKYNYTAKLDKYNFKKLNSRDAGVGSVQDALNRFLEEIKKLVFKLKLISMVIFSISQKLSNYVILHN